MDKIKRRRMPIFLLDDIGAEMDGVSFVEEICVELGGVGVSIDEHIGVGTGEDGRFRRRGTALTRVGECASNVTHAVDANGRRKGSQIGDVFLLV